MKRFTIFLFLGMVLSASTCLAAVYRVSPTGSDNDTSHNGSSWTSAFRTIQHAIDVASRTPPGGGEVWVACDPDNASFAYVENLGIPSDVYVYGGFAGTETARHQRHWKTNVTVLDGGGTDCVVRFAYSANNGLDGFTLRNGNTRSASGQGGGITCVEAAPLIAHNRIVGNLGYSGGGIHCEYGAATIAGNLIIGNGATENGGALCSLQDDSRIVNNTTVGNVDGFLGSNGCVLIDHYAAPGPLVANNLITANASGISLAYLDGSVTLRCNCVFGNGRPGDGLAMLDYLKISPRPVPRTCPPIRHPKV